MRFRHRLKQRSRPSLRVQQGNVAPFAILTIAGGLMATAYVMDTSRMSDNSAQLKRATDAAVLAVGQERMLDSDRPMAELQTLAEGYISHNLGMDQALADNVSLDKVTLTTTSDDDNFQRYTVSAQFQAESPLLGAATQTLKVASTAEVRSRPTEIAVVIPSTLSESNGDIAALKRLGKYLNQALLKESNQVWLSLVPYSQAVNIYSDEDSQRLQRWAAPGATTPSELKTLFQSGKASSLADPRIPDRRANLLCMYRGLAAGENFDWDQPPAGQFRIYYRHDLPENGSPGAPPISWTGPNPDLGGEGAEDTRWMVADKGCPNAALLPLTQDPQAVESRLDQLSPRFNVNYAIAMSWAGASLSPNMRGSDGWGDPEHPLEFNASGQSDNQKIIIMLANTTGKWFDTDAYNFNPGEGSGETGTEGAINFARQRFIDLCRSFQSRGLKFFFIGVRPGDPEDFGRQLFDQVAGPGLQICTAKGGDFQFVDAENFATGEDQVQNQLDQILNDIQLNNSIRLVE
ncbi:hypothetical protein BFW38_00595 [Terasakiispira papahanaumokuakeensis]|uniref:Putative Flp pilus-assembly TadG-like N-terminal domain-containing protein n=1 Tax=Terasakiispira papahanaumokuakeensis TaxID=197479 RepID=A0A1E2V5I4_9GAMM|nr:Tad domain-containing protein [Terasakiispira papahanaumokuakeensis]ODC02260.1 hypothetical protein BFW38_00595 [Terasakiispira papahanaumokuakeensis]